MPKLLIGCCKHLAYAWLDEFVLFQCHCKCCVVIPSKAAQPALNVAWNQDRLRKRVIACSPLPNNSFLKPVVSWLDAHQINCYAGGAILT